MSSSTGHHDPKNRGQLRRAIHRITTPFRRADGHDNSVAPDFPQPSSTASPTRDAQQQTVPHGGNEEPSNVHSAPLVVAPDSSEALLAASDSASEDLSALDPSLYAGRGSNRDIVMGEWTMDRTSAHSQRAQRLMARYGVEFQPNDNPTPNPPTVVHRVQRAPRMRIHRACHQCGIDFSQHKKCRVCGHEICKRCPRSSGRRGEALAHMGFPSNAANHGASVSESGPSAFGIDHQHDSASKLEVVARLGDEQYATHKVSSSNGHSEQEDKPLKGKSALLPRPGQPEDSQPSVLDVPLVPIKTEINRGSDQGRSLQQEDIGQSSAGPSSIHQETPRRLPLPSEVSLLAQPMTIEGLERDGSNEESLAGISNHPLAQPAVSTDVQVSAPRIRESQAHTLGRSNIPVMSLVRNVRRGSSIRYLSPISMPKAEGKTISIDILIKHLDLADASA